MIAAVCGPLGGGGGGMVVGQRELDQGVMNTPIGINWQYQAKQGPKSGSSVLLT